MHTDTYESLHWEARSVKPTPDYKKVVFAIKRVGLPTEYRIKPFPPEPARAADSRVQIYRNMVKVKVVGTQPPQLVGSKRGAVAIEFDGKKRKRMLDQLNAWQFPNQNPIFVHLTYPADFPLDWTVWKNDLRRFKQMLLRKWPLAQGLWKLELQRRGAPHFHIIVDLCAGCNIKRFRQWLDAAWARIAHQNDKYGGRFACRAEIVTSERHARNYVAKYMTKPNFAPVDSDGVISTPESLGESIGRQWGLIGKPNCDATEERAISRACVRYMQLRASMELKKRGARGWWALANPQSEQGWTVYGIGSASDDRYQMGNQLFEQWLEDWYQRTLPARAECERLWRIVNTTDENMPHPDFV